MKNREIKYRYWDSFNEVMRYSQPDEYADYLSKFFIEHDAALEGGNNPILMQFTGLHDSKGVEIYEGDIIEYPTRFNDKEFVRMKIVYVESGWGVMNALFTPTHFENMERYVLNESVVIGNVFEHPHLLTPSIEG